MYRIYDLKEECWLDDDNVIATQDDDVIFLKKCMFNKYKIHYGYEMHRYVIHHGTKFFDKNDREIYEGDIVELKFNNSDKTFSGIVCYGAPYFAGYIISNPNDGKYLKITDKICGNLSVIGNVFDDKNKVTEISGMNGEENEEEIKD